MLVLAVPAVSRSWASRLKRLTDIVMQLPGDVLALFFLCVEEVGGQAAQLVLGLVEGAGGDLDPCCADRVAAQ